MLTLESIVFNVILAVLFFLMLTAIDVQNSRSDPSFDWKSAIIVNLVSGAVVTVVFLFIEIITILSISR